MRAAPASAWGGGGCAPPQIQWQEPAKPTDVVQLGGCSLTQSWGEVAGHAPQEPAEVLGAACGLSKGGGGRCRLVAAFCPAPAAHQVSINSCQMSTGIIWEVALAQIPAFFFFSSSLCSLAVLKHSLQHKQAEEGKGAGAACSGWDVHTNTHIGARNWSAGVARHCTYSKVAGSCSTLKFSDKQTAWCLTWETLTSLCGLRQHGSRLKGKENRTESHTALLVL